ncbi:MAG: hypothetical protein ABIJ08_01985 [Nanoarchaeota archaeon]
MASTKYNANISQGGTNVDIMLEKIEDDFNKQLVDVVLPKQGTPDTIIIDLKKLKRAVTLTGWLEDSAGSSALTKRSSLVTLMQTQGLKTLTWNDTPGGGSQISLQGNINSCKISQIPERRGDDGSDTQTFIVQMIFFVGTISKG